MSPCFFQLCFLSPRVSAILSLRLVATLSPKSGWTQGRGEPRTQEALSSSTSKGSLREKTTHLLQWPVWVAACVCQVWRVSLPILNLEESWWEPFIGHFRVCLGLLFCSSAGAALDLTATPLDQFPESRDYRPEPPYPVLFQDCTRGRQKEVLISSATLKPLHPRSNHHQSILYEPLPGQAPWVLISCSGVSVSHQPPPLHFNCCSETRESAEGRSHGVFI